MGVAGVVVQAVASGDNVIMLVNDTTRCARCWQYTGERVCCGVVALPPSDLTCWWCAMLCAARQLPTPARAELQLRSHSCHVPQVLFGRRHQVCGCYGCGGALAIAVGSQGLTCAQGAVARQCVPHVGACQLHRATVRCLPPCRRLRALLTWRCLAIAMRACSAFRVLYLNVNQVYVAVFFHVDDLPFEVGSAVYGPPLHYT